MHLILYLLAINLLTFFLYWQDKRSARRSGYRTPEYVLLLAGFLGGTLAAVAAQQRLRHKTRKGSFQFKFWTLTVIQIGLLIVQPTPLPGIFRRFFA
jgi:uncharacterized membrane protein YsdA (DUF1294 family)